MSRRLRGASSLELFGSFSFQPDKLHVTIKQCALTKRTFRNSDVYGAEALDTPKLESEQNRKDGVVRQPWKRRKAPLLEAPGRSGVG